MPPGCPSLPQGSLSSFSFLMWLSRIPFLSASCSANIPSPYEHSCLCSGSTSNWLCQILFCSYSWNCLLIVTKNTIQVWFSFLFLKIWWILPSTSLFLIISSALRSLSPAAIYYQHYPIIQLLNEYVNKWGESYILVALLGPRVSWEKFFFLVERSLWIFFHSVLLEILYKKLCKFWF